jgi:hypothetical protein
MNTPIRRQAILRIRLRRAGAFRAGRNRAGFPVIHLPPLPRPACPAIYHSTNCSASGSGAECFTGNGGIRNPTGGVFVKVTSSPSGRNVTVGWDVSCGNSSSDPSFTNRTTHTYRVHLPAAHPKFCTISGFAFINGSARGTIHLSIFYYR